MLLTEAEQSILLALAWDAITHGIKTGKKLKIVSQDYPVALRQIAASFVTLERQQQLRGCIGRLEASRPLLEDVCENAYAAAFRDRRFSPLTSSELEGLELHISILSLPEPIVFNNEQDLIDQLRPELDGLILEDGGYSATFLPSVWASLTESREFLQHLKRKAGLSADYWSTTIKAYRYTTVTIG